MRNEAMAEKRRVQALQDTIHEEAFYESQIQLVTRRRVPFNHVEWPEYQALLMSINPEIERYLIQSHNTVPVHIEASFKRHFQTTKKLLSKSKSQIHFSIDLWSSPFRKSFLAICGQFVDENYILRKVLLGLPQLKFSHSGEAMVGAFAHNQ
jgi:hypothetical protein